MKTRSSFVSNSSSSSFAIVGVSDGYYIELIAEAVGAKFPAYNPEYYSDTSINDDEYTTLNYGRKTIDGILFAAYSSSDEPSYAGLDAEYALETMSIREARKHFQQLMHDIYNINIPFDLIQFTYGECSDGH